MNLRSIGSLVGIMTATVGGHAALVQHDDALRKHWSDHQDMAVRSAVRDELAPLREEVARAHRRVDDVVLASTRRLQ